MFMIFELMENDNEMTYAVLLGGFYHLYGAHIMQTLASAPLGQLILSLAHRI